MNLSELAAYLRELTETLKREPAPVSSRCPRKVGDVIEGGFLSKDPMIIHRIDELPDGRFAYWAYNPNPTPFVIEELPGCRRSDEA